LEIYCSLQQWKNFANTPRIDKVIAMVRVAPFFWLTVYIRLTAFFQDNLGKLAQQVEQPVVQPVNFYVLVITSQYIHPAPRIFSLVSET